MVKQFRVNQGWSLAVVKAVKLTACVRLTLSCWVCLVSGTFFSIHHLLLVFLFFKLTTPCSFLLFTLPPYLQTCFLFLLVGVTSSIILPHNAVCSYDIQTSVFKQQLSQRQLLLLYRELFARERPCCQQVLVKQLAWTFHFNSGQSWKKLYHTPLKRSTENDTLSWKHSRMKYLVLYHGDSNVHIIEDPLLMLIEHK